jgi:hypothetical protein
MNNWKPFFENYKHRMTRRQVKEGGKNVRKKCTQLKSFRELRERRTMKNCSTLALVRSPY